MVTTNEIGNITQAQVLAALVRIGKRVLVPFGNIGRYDLMIDEGDNVVRVECKTGRLRNGVVVFNTESRGGYGMQPGRGYTGDADIFGVYSEDTGEVYLVPVELAAKNSMYLRVTEPKAQANLTKINWAARYKI
jgi:hypothetical protein